VSKDQAIGGLIFLVCIVIIIGYIAALFFPVEIAKMIGFRAFKTVAEESTFRYHAIAWLVAIPVLIALVAVLGIGAWIGWTMATTPPPKPIEEIEAEEKKEEEKEKAAEEEKKK
jgi:Na+-transporting methylmalonyl-CoA/oxaloacetate decarboxylase gamma subunit